MCGHFLTGLKYCLPGGYNSIGQSFPGHNEAVEVFVEKEECTSAASDGSFKAGSLNVLTKTYNSCKPGGSVSNWTIIGGQACILRELLMC